MRPGDGANDVEGIFDIGDPVAHGLVERIFEGLGAAFDRHHGGTQEFHAVDVGRLPLDVLAAHVNHAFESEARRHGGGGYTVLAGAGLGDHPRLAHAAGQQGLAHRIVHLVRAGVVEVFALEVDLRPALDRRQALGMVNRARPAHIVLEFGFEFGHEFGIGAVMRVGALEFVKRVHQGFGDKDAAIGPEVSVGVRQVVTCRRGRGEIVDFHVKCPCVRRRRLRVAGPPP